MDPLITNRIDPARPSVMEKRGDERAPEPRRKRRAMLEKAREEEEIEQELGFDTPRHSLDDLA
jgi:hypothetical protein